MFIVKVLLDFNFFILIDEYNWMFVLLVIFIILVYELVFSVLIFVFLDLL